MSTQEGLARREATSSMYVDLLFVSFSGGFLAMMFGLLVRSNRRAIAIA